MSEQKEKKLIAATAEELALAKLKDHNVDSKDFVDFCTKIIKKKYKKGDAKIRLEKITFIPIFDKGVPAWRMLIEGNVIRKGRVYRGVAVSGYLSPEKKDEIEAMLNELVEALQSKGQGWFTDPRTKDKVFYPQIVEKQPREVRYDVADKDRFKGIFDTGKEETVEEPEKDIYEE